MSYEPLLGLARQAKRMRMEMQCDPQWVMTLAAERDALRAEVELLAARDAEQAAPVSMRDERDAFETTFPVPSHCIRVGNTYAKTEFNAWAAQDYGEIRRGWLAALEFMGTPSAAPTPPAQQLEQLRHERDALAEAIGKAAEKAGITSPGAHLTGPMLLMLCDDLAECCQRAEAPPAHQSVPAGYVIVPLEPTAEMALAGTNVDIGLCENAEDECFEIYRAMLAAALTTPEQLQSESQNIPEIIPAPEQIEHLDVAVLVAALKDIIKHYPNPDISHVDYRVHACKCAESALSALQDQDPDDLIVYRVTLPSGETCNFGNESLARAWARGPAKIEPIKLKPVAELYAVDVPAQAKESE